MEYLLWYIIIFLIIFIIYYLFDFRVKEKKDNLGLSKSFYFITKKYALNMDKKRVRTLSKILVLANSFIISIPIFLVIFNEINYFVILIISFFIFIVLILIVYNLIGYILKKKGW